MTTVTIPMLPPGIEEADRLLRESDAATWPGSWMRDTLAVAVREYRLLRAGCIAPFPENDLAAIREAEWQVTECVKALRRAVQMTGGVL